MNKFKKIISIGLSGAMILSAGAITALAGRDNVSVYLNDQPMNFDVQPYTENDRTMVPVYNLCEQMGWLINWDEEEQSANVYDGYASVDFTVGQDYMVVYNYINDVEVAYDLETPPYIENDRIMVSLRAISECFGVEISWDENTESVLMYDTTPEYDYGDNSDFNDFINDGLDGEFDGFDDFDYSSPDFDDFIDDNTGGEK